MPVTRFNLLDIAIIEGGTSLTATTLGGKSAKALREELVRDGLLIEKSKKFSLTPAGKAAWQKEASAERVDEVTRQEKDLREREIESFVELVREKRGSKLTAPQLARLNPAARDEAIELGFVGNGTKAGVFVVLPAGENYLRTALVRKQLRELRHAHQQMMAKLSAAQEQLRPALESLGQDASTFEPIEIEIRRRAAQAGEAFQKVSGEIAGFGQLLDAATRFKQSVESRVAEAKQRDDAEGVRLAELRARVERVTESQSRFAEESQSLGKRIEELAHKMTTVSLSHVSETRPSTPAPPPLLVTPALPVRIAPGETVERELVSFVAAWEQKTAAGCQFDVLMAHLRQNQPDLTIGAFHDILRKLDEGGRLRLTGWPKSPDEMPEPELALFISSKVMYYARLPQGHG